MSYLAEIVKNIEKEFKINFLKAFKAKNTHKVSTSDPVEKTVTSSSIHRAIFAKAFGMLMNMEERLSSSSASTSEEFICFNINSIKRTIDIFGLNPLICFNKFGDLALATPIMVVRKDFGSVVKGQLVIKVDDKKVFVPGGFEEKSVCPLHVVIGKKRLDPAILPVKCVEGCPITVKKGRDFVSVRSEAGDHIEEGDFLVVRGKSYLVYAKNNDDAFTTVEGERNIIRIKGTFLNNVTRQKFQYRKCPNLCGEILSVDESFLLPYRPIDIKFIPNKNGTDHGNVELKFFNFIFNASGFLTHDRAIPAADV